MASFQQRLEGIYRLSERLAEIDDSATLSEQALRIIVEHFNYEYAAILLKQGPELELVTHASKVPPEELEVGQGASIPLGRGITGRAAQLNETLVIGDVDQDTQFIQTHPDIRSEIAVPIVGEEDVYGVLNVESRDLHAFTDEDRSLLETLARQISVAFRSIRRRRDLERALREQAWLHEFVKGLNEANDLETLLYMTLEHAIDWLAPKADAGSVMRYIEESREYRYIIAINRDLEALSALSFHEDDLQRDASLKGYLEIHEPVIMTRSSVHEKMTGAVQRLNAADIKVPGSSIILPIRDPENDRAIAFFILYNLEREGVFTVEDTEKIRQLEPEITAALLRAQDRERLRRDAVHDQLTDVHNRHYLMEALQREQARSHRSSQPFSLVMIDIDDFSGINNRYGHLEGDRVLKAFARWLMTMVRDVDIVVRYGGDEFLVLMPETTRSDARMICHRLEADLEQTDFELRQSLTISLGFATWHPESNRSVEDLLDEADHWMYRRKRT